MIGSIAVSKSHPASPILFCLAFLISWVILNVRFQGYEEGIRSALHASTLPLLFLALAFLNLYVGKAAGRWPGQ
jgi:uncharacterized membrane protein